MGNLLTEPIIITRNQSAEFLNSLIHPNPEYMQKRDNIFNEIDQTVKIQRNGMDIEVEIPDLDLSFIDNMKNP